MNHQLFLWTLTLGFAIGRLGDLWVHFKHKEAVKLFHGFEVAPAVSRALYGFDFFIPVGFSLIFMGMNERWFEPQVFPTMELKVAGLGFIVVGMGLRVAMIMKQGSFWTLNFFKIPIAGVSFQKLTSQSGIAWRSFECLGRLFEAVGLLLCGGYLGLAGVVCAIYLVLIILIAWTLMRAQSFVL